MDITALPSAGSGGLLGQESGGLPTLPFIFLGLGVATLAAGITGWCLSRIHR